MYRFSSFLFYFPIQELEKKFSQTGAYKNLKSMLSKKNDQIKDLRSRLKNYEGDD